jgi:probable rRNA maturation factor
MSLCLDLQIAITATHIPTAEQFELWAKCCVADIADIERKDIEVSLRIVDSEEITALNLQYRDKNKATNVLSFPADFPEELNIPLLGDIVICAEVVEQEACEQEKNLTAHWAHMLIHGMLHLLGHDHIEDDQAEIMEALEIKYLNELGFQSPY